MAEDTNILKLPFKWATGDPKIESKKSISDREGNKTRVQLVFKPVQATISYKGPPRKEGMQWSWKFKEDVTETESGYPGNFWQVFDYEMANWCEPNCEENHEDSGHVPGCDGYEKNGVVDVVLKIEQKKVGSGWFYNIERMSKANVIHDGIDEATEQEDTPKVLTTDNRICKSVSFNNATLLIVACIENPENAKKVLGEYSAMLPSLIDDWEFNYTQGLKGLSPKSNDTAPDGSVPEIGYWEVNND